MPQPWLEDDGYYAYLNQLHDHRPIDPKTELQLALRWRNHGDLDAAHLLVTSNLRFVVKIANGYRNYGMKVADLVEEGNLGLLEAVRRFDPDRGHRFMTYAAYWVRAYILAHVLKQRTMVSVGTGPLQSKMFFRLSRERARLALVMGSDQSDMDQRLADVFGTTPERVREMAGRIEGRDVSLDMEVFEDGATRVLDLVADDAVSTEERCADAERDRLVRERVATAMQGLSRRERYIVEHRLLVDEGETLAQIGHSLGISRERVRQLEEGIKAKLSRMLADLADTHESMMVAATAQAA